LVLSLAACFLIPVSGCITTAAIVTVAALSQAGGEEGVEGDEYILTAQIDRDADEIFNTALRLLQAKPDVKITRQWERNRRIDANRGLDTFSLKVTPVGQNKSQVVLAVRAGDSDLSHEELAKSAMKTLCDDLGVQYRIVTE